MSLPLFVPFCENGPYIGLHNKTKPAYSIRKNKGVPNLVFCFKCYNLPFFGWRYGNVNNYSVVLIILYVVLSKLSQYVRNYRPTHEQTNILYIIDQLHI